MLDFFDKLYYKMSQNIIRNTRNRTILKKAKKIFFEKMLDFLTNCIIKCPRIL